MPTSRPMPDHPVFRLADRTPSVRNLLFALILTALPLASLGAPDSSVGESVRPEAGTTINHVVIVWMAPEFQNPAAVAELIAAHDMLRDIPGLLSLSVGRPITSDRPIVDDSFAVASVFRFASIADMEAYVTHPIHQAFLAEHTKDKVGRVVVYDF